MYIRVFKCIHAFFFMLQEEQRRVEDADHSLTANDRADRENLRRQQMAEVAAFSMAEADGLGDDPVLKGAHWSEKVCCIPA